jgi:hypothetical protein
MIIPVPIQYNVSEKGYEGLSGQSLALCLYWNVLTLTFHRFCPASHYPVEILQISHILTYSRVRGPFFILAGALFSP